MLQQHLFVPIAPVSQLFPIIIISIIVSNDNKLVQVKFIRNLNY